VPLEEGDTFAITEGVLQVDGGGQGKRANAEALWQIISDIIPASYHRYIISFSTFNRPFSDTLAFVEPTTNSLDTWRMRVNTAGVFDGEGVIQNQHELISTLIHEFAHILTLHANQTLHTDGSICPARAYQTNEGCFTKDAYLTRFVAEFWNDDVFEDAGERYDADPAVFVTAYAAENPEEDIAETFSYYVLLDREAAKNHAGSEKVNFLAQIPELSALRSEIRRGIQGL